jgi:hypothetical protein
MKGMLRALDEEGGVAVVSLDDSIIKVIARYMRRARSHVIVYVNIDDDRGCKRSLLSAMVVGLES